MHVPENGADTPQAKYRIFDGDDWHHRTINQRWNENLWVDLGSFQLSNGAYVELDNEWAQPYGLTRPVAIAYDAIAFVPSSKPGVAVVGIGDSYASGEGIEPYYSNSDVGRRTAGFLNSCHRSSEAYPEQVFDHLAQTMPGPHEYHGLMCAGARMHDVTDGNRSKNSNGEVAQIDAGFLDENTTHVLVTISGNDARFSAILKGCIMTATHCLAEHYHLTDGDGNVDPEPLIDYQPQVIAGLEDDLEDLLDEIVSLAPNADVILTGYPHVLVDDPAVPGTICSQVFDRAVLGWFGDMVDLLDAMMASTAATSGATFVDPRSTFDGHGACASSSYEWINAVILWSDSGSGRDYPGRGSFHPKSIGQEHLAADVIVALQD